MTLIFMGYNQKNFKPKKNPAIIFINTVDIVQLISLCTKENLEVDGKVIWI